MRFSSYMAAHAPEIILYATTLVDLDALSAIFANGDRMGKIPLVDALGKIGAPYPEGQERNSIGLRSKTIDYLVELQILGADGARYENKTYFLK